MSEVLLLGSTIPSYVAALELAKLGITVRVTGAAPKLPRRPVRDTVGAVEQLFADLAKPIAPGSPAGETIEVLHEEPVRVNLAARDGKWKPQPYPAVFGIPTTVPLSSDCMAVLGTAGAFRAYLDRIKPVLTIGEQENTAQLVDARIGAAARNLLVEPFVFEALGVTSAEVDVAMIAPGLNEALTRTGSLTGGALQHLDRYVARETTTFPAGGWPLVYKLLNDRLALFGALPCESAPVACEPASGDGGGWDVTDADGRTRFFDAIICDAGTDLAFANEFSEALAALSPEKYRVYAQMGIEEPDSAVFSRSDASDDIYLGLVSDDSGSQWAARIHRADDADFGTWMLTCAGAAESGSDTQVAIEQTAELALLFGLRARPEDALIWSEPAPFVTLAERDRQADRLNDWHAVWADALACAEDFTGGDLSEAISIAREHAVALRRRLAGISD